MRAPSVPMMDAQFGRAQTGAERLRAAALGGFAALLAIAFLVLLAADQAHVVAGAL